MIINRGKGDGIVIMSLSESKTSSKPSEKAKIRVFYQSPVDHGWVKMWIQPNGLVKAIYKPHPQLKTNTKPWKKSFNLDQSEVAKVFKLLKSEKVQQEACPEFPVVPGQLFRLIIVEAQGQAKNQFHCQYLEPKGAIQLLDKEFLAIYALVKKKGKQIIDKDL